LSCDYVPRVSHDIPPYHMIGRRSPKVRFVRSPRFFLGWLTKPKLLRIPWFMLYRRVSAVRVPLGESYRVSQGGSVASSDASRRKLLRRGSEKVDQLALPLPCAKAVSPGSASRKSKKKEEAIPPKTDARTPEDGLRASSSLGRFDKGEGEAERHDDQAEDELCERKVPLPASVGVEYEVGGAGEDELNRG